MGTGYSPDTANRMTSVKDRRGNIMVTNEYDASGRVSCQMLAEGGVFQGRLYHRRQRQGGPQRRQASRSESAYIPANVRSISRSAAFMTPQPSAASRRWGDFGD